MVGVMLFVLGPFLAYFSPRFLSSWACSLFVGPEPVYKPFLFDAFRCVTSDFWTAMVILAAATITGAALILISLNVHEGSFKTR